MSEAQIGAVAHINHRPMFLWHFNVHMAHIIDFTWDFGKLPFPLELGIFFKDFGKKIPQIHKIGKI